MLNRDFSYDHEFVELYESVDTKLLDLEGIGWQLDTPKYFNTLLKQSTMADENVDGNANVSQINMVSLQAESRAPWDKLNGDYKIWKESKHIYGIRVANRMFIRHIHGDIYKHDSRKVDFPYCYNYSCMKLATLGLPFNEKKSDPPKHLTSFISQLINFVTIASTNQAGACGLADLLIVAAWYVDQDSALTTKDIRQELQSFIYSVNQPFRGGIESPFTNVSIYDDYFLDSLLPEYIFMDGSSPKKATVKRLQRIFLDLMNDTIEKIVNTFPVITGCIGLKDSKIQDKIFLDELCKFNQKFGFLNFYAGDTSTLSSCCRLKSNTKNEFFNMFGSGSTEIGSASVASICLPTVQSFEDLEGRVEDALRTNHVRRKIIQDNIDRGLLPLYTHGFMHLQKQYSTIGLVGIYEHIIDSVDYELSLSEYTLRVESLLDKVQQICDKWSKKHGYPVNIEQIPGEGAAVKLAAKARYHGVDNKYVYSNQFIPLTHPADMLDRIEIQGKLDKLFSGGSILHLNVSEEVKDYKDEVKLIEYAISKNVIYFARNSNIYRCEEGHVLVGRVDKCSICGKKITDNFTRVVGFLTNTKNWSKVRREKDYPNRKFYNNIGGGDFEFSK